VLKGNHWLSIEKSVGFTGNMNMKDAIIFEFAEIFYERVP
jgi:hypothetical protein